MRAQGSDKRRFFRFQLLRRLATSPTVGSSVQAPLSIKGLSKDFPGDRHQGLSGGQTPSKDFPGDRHQGLSGGQTPKDFPGDRHQGLSGGQTPRTFRGTDTKDFPGDKGLSGGQRTFRGTDTGLSGLRTFRGTDTGAGLGISGVISGGQTPTIFAGDKRFSRGIFAGDRHQRFSDFSRGTDTGAGLGISGGHGISGGQTPTIFAGDKRFSRGIFAGDRHQRFSCADEKTAEYDGDEDSGARQNTFRGTDTNDFRGTDTNDFRISGDFRNFQGPDKLFPGDRIASSFFCARTRRRRSMTGTKIAGPDKTYSSFLRGSLTKTAHLAKIADARCSEANRTKIVDWTEVIFGTLECRKRGATIPSAILAARAVCPIARLASCGLRSFVSPQIDCDFSRTLLPQIGRFPKPPHASCSESGN